jgi:hypothetical protein
VSIAAHQLTLSPGQNTSILSSFSQRENIFTFKLEKIPLTILLNLCPFLIHVSPCNMENMSIITGLQYKKKQKE